MRSLGHGSILFVNGGSGLGPTPRLPKPPIEFAGEAAFASMLHDTLLLENIHVESGQMTGRQPLTYVRRLQYEFLVHNREARDCARFTSDGL